MTLRLEHDSGLSSWSVLFEGLDCLEKNLFTYLTYLLTSGISKKFCERKRKSSGWLQFKKPLLKQHFSHLSFPTKKRLRTCQTSWGTEEAPRWNWCSLRKCRRTNFGLQNSAGWGSLLCQNQVYVLAQLGRDMTF